MDKVIFYTACGIIIPMLFLLFALGNTIYTLGEFKEHKVKIPHFLFILLLQTFLFSFIILHTFHYFIHNFIPDSFYYLSVILNIYIVFEFLQLNKIYELLRTFLPKDQKENYFKMNLDPHIKTGLTLLLQKNLVFYCLIQILGIISFVLFFVILIHYYSLFFLILFTILCLSFSVKFYLSKYLTTI